MQETIQNELPILLISDKRDYMVVDRQCTSGPRMQFITVPNGSDITATKAINSWMVGEPVSMEVTKLIQQEWCGYVLSQKSQISWNEPEN